MRRTAIVIPTWNNIEHLRLTVDSLMTTQDSEFRLIVVDNASFDETPDFLKERKITSIRMEHNEGFVRGVNSGLRLVGDDEDVLLLNDDVFIVDPLWLRKLKGRLSDEIGAVGPVSNFVMGVQKMELNSKFPMFHETRLLIGFCLLVSAEAYKAVGGLDVRFLMGGNDDLDYSIRLRQAGFKLAVDRSVFVYHYGARSISRIGGYAKIERETRPILVEKWGSAVVDELFLPLDCAVGVPA